MRLADRLGLRGLHDVERAREVEPLQGCLDDHARRRRRERDPPPVLARHADRARDPWQRTTLRAQKLGHPRDEPRLDLGRCAPFPGASRVPVGESRRRRAAPWSSRSPPRRDDANLTEDLESRRGPRAARSPPGDHPCRRRRRAARAQCRITPSSRRAVPSSDRSSRWFEVDHLDAHRVGCSISRLLGISPFGAPATFART